MFRENINTPIDPIPVEYVNTLIRPVYEPDYSLTCLGIAMLKPRIEKYLGIGGGFFSYNKEESCVLDFVDRQKQDDEVPALYYYKYSEENDDANFTKEKLTQCGYVLKENIGAFLKDKANIRCMAFYHIEKNSAVVFIKSSDIRYYHLCISFISLLWPNLFKNKPMRKPEDYSIVTALSKTDKNAFIVKIQEAVRPYVIEFRRLMLGNLIKAMHETKLNASLRDVNNQRATVATLERQYSDAIKQLKDYIVIYEGMKATEAVDKPEEELVEYMATNKDLHNLHIEGNVMSFTVATLLNNYSPDTWETFSRRGYIYDGKYGQNGRTLELLDVFRDRDNRKLLLDNIFNESPEFAIKIAGNYSFDLQTCYVSTSRNFNYEQADPIFQSYLPNPHLKIFSCLGGYEDRIIKALRERNFIGAVELAWASAGSVDLDETEQTFRPFLGWLLTSREKVLKRRDGVEMTPEEAVVYLVDKEKNK